jgi:hypothetical protein
VKNYYLDFSLNGEKVLPICPKIVVRSKYVENGLTKTTLAPKKKTYLKLFFCFE